MGRKVVVGCVANLRAGEAGRQGRQVRQAGRQAGRDKERERGGGQREVGCLGVDVSIGFQAGIPLLVLSRGGPGVHRRGPTPSGKGLARDSMSLFERAGGTRIDGGEGDTVRRAGAHCAARNAA